MAWRSSLSVSSSSRPVSVVGFPFPAIQGLVESKGKTAIRVVLISVQLLIMTLSSQIENTAEPGADCPAPLIASFVNGCGGTFGFAGPAIHAFIDNKNRYYCQWLYSTGFAG
jgi:hypothetical protein